MSKKMMRRSLALGALMAFVITGSAMAANYDEETLYSQPSETVYDDINVTKDVWSGAGIDIDVKANNDINVGIDGILSVSTTASGTSSIKLVAGNEMNLDGSILVASEKSSIDLSAKDIKIGSNISSWNGDNGPAKNAHIKINAKDSINVVGSINANAEKSLIELYANDISVNGDVTANKSTTSVLATSTNTINGSIIAGYEVSSGVTEINISGNEINIDAKNGLGVVSWSAYSADDAKVAINFDAGEDGKVSIKNATYGLMAYGNGTTVDVNAAQLNIKDSTYGMWIANRSVSSGDNLDGGDRSDDAKVVIGADTNVNITNVEVGIVSQSHGTVEINGNLKIDADVAIDTRGEATTLINKADDSTKVIEIAGDIVYDYDDYTVDSNVVINLANDKSSFTGGIYNTGDGKTDGKVTGMELGLSGGATWNVTGDSFVNELTGTDGNVVLKYEGTTDDGVDVVQVDIGENKNENLTVSGDEALTKAIEDGTVDATAALNALNDAVTTTDEKNQEVAVANTVKTAEGKILGSYVLNNEGKAEIQESSMSAAVSEAGMNLKAHWRAHMNDMNKRMGELRFANGESGVWTRMVRGESEYEGAKMQYNQYQLGYDEKLSVDKRWTVGAAVTFSEGDSSYGQGSSDDKSTAFAIYGSKLNNDGTFVDLIARYARLESDIEDSVYKNGEYDTNGMSVSAEFGKRIQQGNGLWIEPQVELTYGTVDSASVRFDDGSVANYGDMDSFIGRVGFSLGKDIKQGNVYARASYLYDFDGETETTFTNGKVSGKPVEEDFGGGWWEVGVGANINLSKATYIYADIEKTFGGEVDTNWQWNLGVRYSF